MALWKLLDAAQQPSQYINASDEVYYAREYIPRGGHSASEANSLIYNLKKTPDRKGKPEWRYKEDAIRQFAREIAMLLVDDSDEWVVAAIPSSKAISDPDYDDRLDQVLKQAATVQPRIRIETPFVRARSSLAAHYGGARTPEQIMAELSWRGFSRPTDHLILVDDVLTTGGHFRACSNLVSHHQPAIQIYGVFWARTIRVVS